MSGRECCRDRPAKLSSSLLSGRRPLRSRRSFPGHPAQQGDSTVAKKLYVGNLSFGVTESQLQEMLAPYGSVQLAQLITDRDTARSKGIGFVETGSDQDPQAP